MCENLITYTHQLAMCSKFKICLASENASYVLRWKLITCYRCGLSHVHTWQIKTNPQKGWQHYYESNLNQTCNYHAKICRSLVSVMLVLTIMDITFLLNSLPTESKNLIRSVFITWTALFVPVEHKWCKIYLLVNI